MIPAGDIHFWSAPVLAEPPDAWLDLFDEDERRRAARFTHQGGRREFLSAHCLLRRMLAFLTGMPPQAFTFQRGEKGKPALTGPAEAAGLQFNLSHTRGRVVCAVARGVDLGVDVEAADRPVKLEVADRYFAGTEIAWIHSLPPAEKPLGFLRLWTLKEAWIKAIAKGLSQPLQDFAFSFDPLAIRFAPAIGADPAQWRFARPDAGPDHLAALAVHWSGPGEPVLWVRRLAAPDQAAEAVPPVRAVVESGAPARIGRSREAMPAPVGHSRG